MMVSIADPKLEPVNIKPLLEVANFKLRSSKQDNEFMDTLFKK